MPIIAAVVLLFAVVNAKSQTTSPTPEPGRAAASSNVKSPDEKLKAPDPAAKIKRWFEFENLTISTRYRFIRTANDVVQANQLQWQFQGRARFKFDSKGRYSVFAGLETGPSLTSGWNNTGIGTGDGQTNLYLKRLYFDAKPVKQVEFQIGSLFVNNGESTEATGYDNDVYITGERLLIRHPKKLFFDEISLTNANVGEILHPSVFRRFDEFRHANYHQFLVRKQVNKRVGFSADYTFESHIDTFRQAIRVKAPETRFADLFVFENYQRFDGPGRYGFNVFGEKKVGKKLTLDGGFAHIDATLLNGDRYQRGNRVHATAVYKFRPEFSVTAFIIHGIGPIAPNLNRTRFDLIFTYNILETLRRHKLQ